MEARSPPFKIKASPPKTTYCRCAFSSKTAAGKYATFIFDYLMRRRRRRLRRRCLDVPSASAGSHQQIDIVFRRFPMGVYLRERLPRQQEAIRLPAQTKRPCRTRGRSSPDSGGRGFWRIEFGGSVNHVIGRKTPPRQA